MLYAKSDPLESINEHTEKLLKNLKILRNLYENIVDKNPNVDERLWKLLEIACVYHDIGKVYTPFQNIILEKLGKEKLYTKFDYEGIKHEQLSPMFIPTDDLNYTEKKLIYQAIYYHHYRVHKKVNSNLVEQIIKDDILPRYDNIRSEIKYKLKDDLNCNYLGYVLGRNKIDEESEVYIKYCLLKGLLHRLDHSSSADVLVENKTEQALGECTENSLKFKGYNGKNELQKFCKDNISNNILVIGSTGIGKTEAATIWSNIGKTFFTLPIRTSINAIYDRIKFDIGYKDVGLLHSSAVDYLEEKEDKFDYHLYEQTKNFGNRVIVCTIDQIFPFVFRYNGYEKIYATLAFSKVIIDEIQAYSPEITAIILKGIKMINDIGGKFMIMTATLPRIYKDELEKMGIKFKFGKFLKPIMRHKLSIKANSLDNDIENIINKASSSKVLVILNKIDKANELYLKIKEKNIENVNVLHSRFIKNDRSNKENSIIAFSKDREKTGIWITTQIVEASLDIDFDYLFTEMSTLDSLFQRCGRCYRSREYKKNEPNIYLYNKNVSGIGDIYDKEIHRKSIQLITQYDNKILTEKDKVNLVDTLYSKENIQDTKFYNDFKDSLRILDNFVDDDSTKAKAQKMLRKIESVNVIPREIYDKNIELFEKYENMIKAKEYKEANVIKREINKLTLSLKKNMLYKNIQYITNNGYHLEEIKVIDLKYDQYIGLHLNPDLDDEIDQKFM